ncbi:MAG: hypothetical protein ACRDLV_02160 [Solirubrobacteraceae bacterium]
MDASPHRARASLAIAALAVAGALAGCGGGVGSSTAGRPGSSTAPASSSSTSAATPTTAHRHRPHRRRPGPRGAPVGRTQLARSGTTRLEVTVTRVMDPLRGVASPPPGARAIGVQVTVRNVGSTTYDSTASGDLGVRTSAGPGSPLFVHSGACQTQLVDFESLIGAGETRSGCVGFSVPRHSRVLSVTFSPHSRARGRVAWR